MFCFQCDQAAKCTNLTDKTRICGKSADTALLQNRLIGALIGLARATDGNEHLISSSSTAVIAESLPAALSDKNVDSATLKEQFKRVEEEKRKMVPNCFLCACPCGKNSDYDINMLQNAGKDIRDLKSQLLLGIRDLAVKVCRAAALGRHDEAVNRFFYKALIVIGMDDFSAERLLSIIAELEEAEHRCKAMPDTADP